MTLPDDLKSWPEDALEAYRERVAIMIVDGNMLPEDARRLANARVRREWKRKSS